MTRNTPYSHHWSRAVGLFVLCLLPGPVSLSAEKDPLAVPIKRLLTSGVPNKGRGNLKVATEQYELAKGLNASDARAEHALALALFAQSRPVDAFAKLKEARELNGSYLPAYTTAISMNCALDKFRDAAAEIKVLTPRIVAAGSGISDEQKSAAAEWLGQLLGFYLGPGETILNAAPVREADTTITAELPEKLRADYERGKLSTQEQFKTLQLGFSTKSEAMQKQARLMREERLEKLSSQSDVLIAETERLKRDADAWKKWYDGEMEPLNKLVVPVLQRLQFLMDAEGAAKQTLKLTLLRTATGYTPDRALENLLKIQFELAQTRRMLEMIVARASLVHGQYVAAVGSNAVTGQQIENWRKELDEVRKLQTKQELPPEQTLKNIDKRLRDLRNYVSVDLPEQRDLLLKTFASPTLK